MKKNFERVSLLTRLEDHPYLRDDQDVVQDDTQSQGTDGMLLQLNDEERQRLMKMISTPGPQTLSMERIQMAPGQGQHILQQHQIPSTSSYTNVSGHFFDILNILFTVNFIVKTDKNKNDNF